MTINGDQLMAWEAAGAADYRRARAAGFSDMAAFAAATTTGEMGDADSGLLLPQWTPGCMRERARTSQRPLLAECYARTAGALEARAEVGE